MKVLQRSEFKKAYKRLHDNQRSLVFQLAYVLGDDTLSFWSFGPHEI